MASTPEGKIKAKIKKVLDAAPHCYYHMPVQNGMGRPTLDFICCSDGRFFAIEAKAPGKYPTVRQIATMEAIEDARGEVFLVNDDRSLELLRLWIGCTE